MLDKSLAGAPGRIRTSDPQIRSLVLYPAELRALVAQSLAGATSAEAADLKGSGAVGKPHCEKICWLVQIAASVAARSGMVTLNRVPIAERSSVIVPP